MTISSVLYLAVNQHFLEDFQGEAAHHLSKQVMDLF